MRYRSFPAYLFISIIMLFGDLATDVSLIAERSTRNALPDVRFYTSAGSTRRRRGIQAHFKNSLSETHLAHQSFNLESSLN
jgi:hypothetical protein